MLVSYFSSTQAQEGLGEKVEAANSLQHQLWDFVPHDSKTIGSYFLIFLPAIDMFHFTELTLQQALLWKDRIFKNLGFKSLRVFCLVWAFFFFKLFFTTRIYSSFYGKVGGSKKSLCVNF